MKHRSQKILQSNFGPLWERLNAAGQQYLVTPHGHKFTAESSIGKQGSHQQQNVIRIKQHEQEFARIYECCWRHTTNCYGTRIGGYSDGLDTWFKGLMISKESLIMKPNDKVIDNFGKLLNSFELGYEQALIRLPKEPGVYLVYDKKQKKYIYCGKTKDIRKRIQQHARLQNKSTRFLAQQVQKGLIDKGRCNNSQEAQKYLFSNCTVKHLVIPDEKRRKYPWINRSLLDHYAVCVIEPEYNISGEFDH